VEKANALLKWQLTKRSLNLKLAWPSLLPLALTCLRLLPRKPLDLNPFELLYDVLSSFTTYPTPPPYFPERIYGPLSIFLYNSLGNILTHIFLKHLLNFQPSLLPHNQGSGSVSLIPQHL
jgi:hypothetical protein